MRYDGFGVISQATTLFTLIQLQRRNIQSNLGKDIHMEVGCLKTVDFLQFTKNRFWMFDFESV
jgi:hypothetical protein